MDNKVKLILCSIPTLIMVIIFNVVEALGGAVSWWLLVGAILGSFFFGVSDAIADDLDFDAWRELKEWLRNRASG